jgi:uncharacterized protein YqgV (UPF0045/DUF77 family)
MKINAAIQLLPIGAKDNRYGIIDQAIRLIGESGLNYKVCPFETVVEGEPEAVYRLIRKIQEETLKLNCDELLINIKIHAATRDLSFDEKLEKYQD